MRERRPAPSMTMRSCWCALSSTSLKMRSAVPRNIWGAWGGCGNGWEGQAAGRIGQGRAKQGLKRMSVLYSMVEARLPAGGRMCGYARPCTHGRTRSTAAPSLAESSRYSHPCSAASAKASPVVTCRLRHHPWHAWGLGQSVSQFAHPPTQTHSSIRTVRCHSDSLLPRAVRLVAHQRDDQVGVARVGPRVLHPRRHALEGLSPGTCFGF